MTSIGVLHDVLVEELAEWIETGFIPATRLARFHRGLKRLARLLGVREHEVRLGLRRDAEVLLAERLFNARLGG